MGGLAKKSFGGMFFVNTPQQRWSGIRDTPEQAWKDWQSVADFEPDDILPRRWAESYVL
jgi:predicted oxidoreductase